MEKYITPQAEVLNMNTQTILAASSNSASGTTPSASIEPNKEIPQGGMEAKQTITSFLFKD